MRLPLETERLTIRPLVIEDAEALHELFSDPVAMQHVASDLPASIEHSQQWVQDKIDLYDRTGLSMCAVVLRQTGDVIGDAGLQLLDANTIEVAARVIRRYWSHGFGREAAVALIEAGFDQLGVERIVGVTAPENAPARRAMEHIGMRRIPDQEHLGREWVVYEARRPT